MRNRYFVATTFMLLLAAFVNAQPAGKKPPATPAGSNQQSDFEYEVTVTPLGLAGIIVRRKSGLGLFTPAMLSSFANQSTKISQSFVIRPDKDAKMADILAAINAIRVSPKTDMRIEVDTELAVFIPQKPDPRAIPKPNPLTLVVSVDEGSNISLNGEKDGSFPDTSKLEQHLKAIFDDRKKNGLAETTVMIGLAKKMSFTNLAQLARAVKSAGSKAIGLQVDETAQMIEVNIPQR